MVPDYVLKPTSILTYVLEKTDVRNLLVSVRLLLMLPLE